MRNKAQATVFIILGILIVAAIVLAVSLSGPGEIEEELPADLQPPYQKFSGCFENSVEGGVRLLGSQGGYIDLPEFEPGSDYSPFSSHLYFSGISLPYWYYVSGNGIENEQVPTKTSMERELENFINEEMNNCDLSEFGPRGYDLERGDPRAEASIERDRVVVRLNMDFSVERGEDSFFIDSHNYELDSSLGNLYDSALMVYEKEQEDLFLEKYGLDVLRLYAPVDGVDITCSPRIWDANDVFDEIGGGLEANTLAIKTEGDGEDYFVVDVDAPNDVRFINSRNWSSMFQVNPSEGPILKAEPVGNQPGLGILGFCYVPYHFVYDVKYPVVIQAYDEGEIFQYPVAVVIEGNQPRKPLQSVASQDDESDICRYRNSLTEINVYGEDNRGVDAYISYECGGTSCYIGEAEDGRLDGYLPQCVNGKLSVNAGGYFEGEKIYTSLNEGGVEIYLDKVYGLDVSLELDGRDYEGEALVSFVSNETSRSVFYPEQKRIELTRGEYDVTVRMFDNASITLGSQVQEQCVEVPKGGLGGLVGLKEEKCFDIEIPEQTVSRVLAGGGTTKVYLLESTLKGSSQIIIKGEALPVPTNLEGLQTNYLLFENKEADIDLR